MSRGDGAIEKALRPTEKEIDAARITIECVEPPSGGGDGYIVTVCPKPSTKKEREAPYNVSEIKRVFSSEEATLAYLKKVL
jgi:hypothetical protein